MTAHNSVGQGEDRFIDSLKAELQTVDSDSMKMALLYDLGAELFYVDLEEATGFGVELLNLARTNENDHYLKEGLILVGWAYLEMSEWDSCQKVITEMIDHGQRQEDPAYVSEAYRIEGVMHSQRADYEKSIQSNQQALDFAKQAEEADLIAATYNNIAMLFHYQDDTLNALKYYDLAANHYLDLQEGDQYLSNILANRSSLERDTSIRLQLLDSAIQLNIAAEEWDLVGSRYASITDLYYELNMPLETLRNARKANQYLSRSTSGDRFDGFRLMAKAYLLNEKYDSALVMADSALIGYEGRAFPNLTNDMYIVKSKAHEARGEYKNALTYANLSLVLSDSLYKDRNKEIIADFNARYETEEKEKQLALNALDLEREKLNKRRLILGGLGGVLILSWIYFVYFTRQGKKKQEAEVALEQQKQKNRTLQELDNLKAQFFTNISHELKTPLTLITGPLKQIMEELKPQEKLYDTLALAERNSRRLLDLVNEILALAKVENSNIAVREKPLEIESFVRRMFFSFESFADSQKIELDFFSDLGPSPVLTDAQHLEKVLTNLITNAIKYTPPQGRVTLNLTGHVEGEYKSIRMAINDTGIGMTEEQVEHVFDRFYQTPEARGKEKGGVGIGLSLAKKLTDALGGELTCHSEIGRGSTFFLDLKLRMTRIEEVPENLEHERYELSVESRKENCILVVEDNPDLQTYLRSILEPYFSVELALDGFDALKKLQTIKIDLVVSDIMMPGMDGYQLRENMLNLDKVKHLPFLYLSARSLEEDIMKGFSLGIDDYITKPFNAKALIARIDALLKNSKVRKEHALEVGYLQEGERSKIQQFEQSLRDNLDKSNLKISQLAEELHISERQLRRITKAETGMSPVEMLLEMRLLKARQLLESGFYGSVAEVMYQIGLESASYFSKKFSERFGVAPSEMI